MTTSWDCETGDSYDRYRNALIAAASSVGAGQATAETGSRTGAKDCDRGTGVARRTERSASGADAARKSAG
jgi:hypothetical protein